MRFGIHHSSWTDGPAPAEAFEAAKAKVQWAEHHGFVWFSVMGHMIHTCRKTDSTKSAAASLAPQLRRSPRPSSP